MRKIWLILTVVLLAAGSIPIAISLVDPQSADAAPILLAQWKFDEQSAGINAEDYIGSNDGVPGTSTATYPTPSVDVPVVAFANPGSMNFNGQNYFTINNPVSLNFTICAWIKTASTGGGSAHWTSAPIMDAEWGGVNFDFGFGVGNGGKLMFGNGGQMGGVGALVDSQVNGNTTINDNVWHNVCVTRNNTNGLVKLYVDAVEDAQGTTGLGALNVRNVARIGWGYDGAALYNGKIDDVRVYDTDLTLQQLENIAGGGEDPDIAPGTPTVSVTSPTVSSLSNSWSPAVSWGDSTTCEYSYDNTVWNAVNCAQSGHDISAPANSNAATLYVRGVRLGYASYGTANVTFAYDNVAPAVNAGDNRHVKGAFAQTSATASDVTSGVASYGWTKQSGPGTVTFSSAAALTPSVTSVTSDGTYVVRLTATDAAGNSAFDDFTLIWDTTSPGIEWQAGGFPDATTTVTTAVFKFVASDPLSQPVTYKCSIDAGTFESCASGQTYSALSATQHTIKVRATDSVGNVSADLVYTWTVSIAVTNDRNGDGVVDDAQKNVAAITSAVSGKAVALEVDSSCDVASSIMEAEKSLASQDKSYDYPQGLLNFFAECGVNGFTSTIKQYYYGIDSSNLVLRKYNSKDGTFFNVENANVTTQVVHGEEVVVVTYQVTDGGLLDVDGQVNGVIVDPAGLARAVVGTGSIASTGAYIAMFVFIGGCALTAGFGFVFFSRKYKRFDLISRH